jgi:hypothetical protein
MCILIVFSKVPVDEVEREDVFLNLMTVAGSNPSSS